MHVWYVSFIKFFVLLNIPTIQLKPRSNFSGGFSYMHGVCLFICHYSIFCFVELSHLVIVVSVCSVWSVDSL